MEAIAEAAPMGEAAMVEAAVAINPSPAPITHTVLVLCKRFRFIPVCIWDQFGITSKGAFSFCIGPPLSISIAPHDQEACLFFMIVCSCNVLSDHDVRNAVSSAEGVPRNAKQLYGCLGCSAECGRCARTIKTIIDEALGPCAEACCAGCPHSARESERYDEAVFALAAS
jgi:bacterioferritin-associated ferredoxin